MRARASRRFAICSGTSFGVSAIGPIKPSTRARALSRPCLLPAEGVEEKPEAREGPEMPEARARQVFPALASLRLDGGEGPPEQAVHPPGAREALLGGRERAFGSG